MPRSTVRIAGVFAMLAAVPILLGACGAPAAPALSDPKEIVTAALRATQSAKTVHVEMKLDGSITADLSGSGGSGAAIALTGTTASADVDIAARNAHASFAVPAFLGLSGDVIQIGDTSYIKTSLTGAQYQKQTNATPGSLGTTDTTSLIANVNDFLSKDGVNPVKGDDVTCGSAQCYTVKIELTPDELTALGVGGVAPSALPIDVSTATVSITIRVEKDSNHLAGIGVTVGLGDKGSLTFDATMSNWDQPVTISAPPADQVQAAA